MYVLNSLVSILISIFLSLVFLVCLTKVIPRGIAVALMLAMLLFWVIHPMLRQEILSIAMPITGAILPLLLIIVGLLIMIRGKVR